MRSQIRGLRGSDVQKCNRKDAHELESLLQRQVEAEENRHGKKEYVQVNHCSNSALHSASQGEPLALCLQLDEQRGPWLARIGCRVHGGQWDVGQVHEQGDDKAKVDGELESSTRRKELSVEQEDGRF